MTHQATSSALIIKHVSHEGGGTIERFLKTHAVHITYCELSQNQALPTNPADFSLVIIMGGPMNVDEHHRYPFLIKEKQFIHQAIEKQVPMVGICLGAQLLAQVLGGRVYKGHQKEIGWKPIFWTSEVENDYVFSGLGEIGMQVLHWHGDTFELPPGACRLAYSKLYQNQAFRHGKHIYAFQFHIETTPDMLEIWFKEDLEDLKGLPETPESIASDAKQFYPILERQAEQIYRRLFKELNVIDDVKKN